MNQWHATLTNAFGEQLPEPVGVLGGGSHNVTAITVTTYDSAYRYINEYGDQFGLLVVDEEHHLPAPTYRQIPEMTIAPYRLGLTATYERPDGKHELLEELLGPVVYRENVDELAGEYLSEYETIHMSVDLTADEGETYDEEYQLYRDYVDSHEFDLWKGGRLCGVPQTNLLRPTGPPGTHRQATRRTNRPHSREETRHARQSHQTASR